MVCLVLLFVCLFWCSRSLIMRDCLFVVLMIVFCLIVLVQAFVCLKLFAGCSLGFLCLLGFSFVYVYLLFWFVVILLCLVCCFDCCWFVIYLYWRFWFGCCLWLNLFVRFIGLLLDLVCLLGYCTVTFVGFDWFV